MSATGRKKRPNCSESPTMLGGVAKKSKELGPTADGLDQKPNTPNLEAAPVRTPRDLSDTTLPAPAVDCPVSLHRSPAFQRPGLVAREKPKPQQPGKKLVIKPFKGGFSIRMGGGGGLNR